MKYKLIIVLTMMFFITIFANIVQAEEPATLMDYTVSNSENLSYKKYSSNHSNANAGKDEVNIQGSDFSNITDDNYKVQGTSVQTSESSSIEYTFDISSPGLYNVGVLYTPIEGKSADIIRSVYIDGEIPFAEANSIIFKRLWINEGDVVTTSSGDDLQPLQIEVQQEEYFILQDDDRIYGTPLEFYLDAGTHTIRFDSYQEPLQIDSIDIFYAEQPSDYQTYIADKTAEGNNDVADYQDTIEGENATLKSSSMLAPEYNFTDVRVNPSDAQHKKINYIGGNKWGRPGDFIEWEINVPSSGFYEISLNQRQNFDRGIFSTRRLWINDEVPFSEANELEFDFNNDFNISTLSDENGEPYKFALNEGTNTIRLEVTLGSLGGIINELEDANFVLNDIYKDVIMLAGTAPDIYRDYNIDRNIVDFNENITALENNLSIISNYISDELGSKNDLTASLDKIILQLRTFMDKPDNIIRQLNTYKSNISALPNTIKNLQRQPLSIDSIIISSPDVEVDDNYVFGSQPLFNVQRFISSFSHNNDVLGADVEGDGETIEVWITRGQDELQVWRSLIDNYFTPDTGINVDLKLVNATAILPAVLSGEGPDVAMYLPQDSPVNYATRSAVTDLTQFSDYDEVASRYYQSAITPFEYDGGVYALGEEQKFPMLFYRTDIFDDLNISVPTTWSELFEILPILNANNMEMMLEPTLITNTGQVTPNMVFSSLLYQNGGEYYMNDDMQTAITQPSSVDAFVTYTKFYTDYSVDVQADFANRFKTGEVPIGIMDYSQYNQISIFAPELSGMWSVAPLPGIVEPDGTINNVAGSSTTGMVMFEDTEYKDASWEFMKWATSDETQKMYAHQFEAKVGRAGRWQSANKNAMEYSSYPAEDLSQIIVQQANTKGVKQVPGGYITARQIDYAFRAVVNENANPVEVIFEYSNAINEEISSKRKEFGLEYIDWRSEDVE